MAKKLIPGTLGLDAKGQRLGERGLSWLMDRLKACDDMPTREQVTEWMTHLPPETLGLMALRMLNELAQAVMANHELMLSLALLDDDEFATIIEQHREALRAYIERIRIACHAIRQLVLARKEAGWPEWDLNTGQVKAGVVVTPPPVEEHVELPGGIEDFLAGLLLTQHGGGTHEQE